MAQTAADFMLDRLSQWGVKRIYGYPGDGINGILGALGRAGERFEFIQCIHEEIAAFCACGHAKYTGEVGIAPDRRPRFRNGRKVGQLGAWAEAWPCPC